MPLVRAPARKPARRRASSDSAPLLKGRRRLHAIRQRKIHATFTDKELRDRYHSFARLLEHDEVGSQEAVRFYAPARMSRRRN
jgi:hypothetical protein